jgi:hypothetical protein
MRREESIPKPVVILLAVGLFLAFTVSVMAQVQSQTSTATAGAATRQVKVERGEVVYVSGNHVMVKMENGEIRDIPNVPESAKVTVDGNEIGVHDLKVGMKLQRTITTTSTPKMVTKVETVTGRVFHVVPPTHVILTMENNENQQFTIPNGQKFNIDGQMVDAFHLRKGMNVTATRVTETPETHVAVEQMISGKLPPPPPPAADAPILVLMVAAPATEPGAEPGAAPVAAEAAPAAPALPKTGSYLPAMGLLGVLMLSIGLGLRAVRGTR